MKNQHPKVTIITITYNQERYIRQALESFVTQKTNFKFEVLIGDDASTDGTPKIINEYAAKYPDIIKPILRTKNLGAMANMVDLFYKANGQYIALCEGDDYFTDDNKLQIQASFLDKNKGHTICFHPVNFFYDDSSQPDFIFPDTSQGKNFTRDRLIDGNYIQTNGVMYRRLDYKNLPTNILPGDWYLHLYHAKEGKIGFINKVMATYRKHSGGVWWEALSNPRALIKKHGVVHLAMYFEVNMLYKNNKKYTGIISTKIKYLFTELAKIDFEDGTSLVEDFVRNYPVFSVMQIYSLLKETENKASIIEDVNQHSLKKGEEIKRLETEVAHLSKDLDNIKSSKLWKYRAAIYGNKGSKG